MNVLKYGVDVTALSLSCIPSFLIGEVTQLQSFERVEGPS